MDLFSRRVIKKLLEKQQLRPSKRLGQNFLIDKKVLEKIISAASLNSQDVVLEIGPGLGSLTQKLAERTKKVIAVEKDQKMIEILKETLKDFENVEIIPGDILKINLKADKVIANLPYYIVSPVIRKFLESKYRPKEMILMVQKEVAQRIYAKPPRMSLLAVSVQFYAVPKIISYVSKKSFWPQPKVDGAIIKLKTGKKRDINKDLFFKVVKAGFSHPRKQILNNLTKGLKLNKDSVKLQLLKNNIQPNQRAETLNIEDWLNLTKNYKQ